MGLSKLLDSPHAARCTLAAAMALTLAIVLGLLTP